MKELELIYRKRKQQLIPLVFGFAAFFVFFRVILPQWTDISEVNDQISKKSKDVEAKKATVRLLNSTSPEAIDENFELVATALPLQKDIVLIYSELINASQATNVELGGFSVKIGGVYSATALEKEASKSITGVPFINILIRVEGESVDIRRFADKLYESIPLVEINTIDISENEARYDVNFYYKPVVARPKNADTLSLEPLTQLEQKQLDELESWRGESIPPQF